MSLSSSCFGFSFKIYNSFFKAAFSSCSLEHCKKVQLRIVQYMVYTGACLVGECIDLGVAKNLD